mgnify:CR=1 FL=1
MDWITIIIIASICGCIYKTSNSKQRIGGVILIILILLFEYFLK